MAGSNAKRGECFGVWAMIGRLGLILLAGVFILTSWTAQAVEPDSRIELNAKLDDQTH